MPMGVHAIDGMIDLCGDDRPRLRQSFRRAAPIDTDDTTSMLFRMKEGMSGYLGTMTTTGAGLQLPGVRLQGLAAARRRHACGRRLVGRAPHAPVRHLQVPAGQRRGESLGGREPRRHPRGASRPSPRPPQAARPSRLRPTRSIHGVAVTEAIIRSAGERQGRASIQVTKSRTTMDLGNGLGHLTYSTLVHPGDTWETCGPVADHLRAAGESALSPATSRSACRCGCRTPRRRRWRRARPSATSSRSSSPTTTCISTRSTRSPTGRSRASRQGAGLRAGLAHGGAHPIHHERRRHPRRRRARRASRRRSRPRRSASSRNVTGQRRGRRATPSTSCASSRTWSTLEKRTGRTVTLALEPEPFCFLETTDETVDYFTNHLYSGAAAEMLAKLAGLPIAEANAALRRHLGIVFDICHQAVEYEDIAAVAAEAGRRRHPDLQAAGSRRSACSGRHAGDGRYAQALRQDHLSDADRGEDATASSTAILNLEDAFAAFEKDPGGQREWRTHFHVPVFLDDLGEFRTTRFAIEDALRFHKQKPLSRQLEIETYTWDVLPDISRPATSSTTSAASSTGCAASWCRRFVILGAAP